MDYKWFEWINDADQSRHLNLRIDVEESDLLRIDWSAFDSLLAEECLLSKRLSDKLLALESLVRKVERIQEEEGE